MRIFLVAAVCLCLAGAAMAQTNADAKCLELGDLAGQPPRVLWTNSFDTFLAAHSSDLSDEQAKLIQQAIELGSSPSFALNDALSLHAIKGLLASARQILTNDQFSEILAGMGPDTQRALVAVRAVPVVACSCTIGSGGCPEGFPCSTGCYTWGTGAWNGVCTMQAEK